MSGNQTHMRRMFMKKGYAKFSVAAVVLLIILSACGARGAAPSEAPITQPGTGPAGEVPGTLVEASIDLAGPLMELGSKFPYVDGSVLAAVPGGAFLMGYQNFVNTPEKEVTLSDYWIYSSEVTNRQYALCVNAGKCVPPNPEQNPVFGNYRFVNTPVVGVNYQQSADYCAFVNGRLPTEAEWEKAARGPEGNLFPWGDAGPACDLLNFNFCNGKILDIQSYPGGVSYYGLFDMAGNVREWVADWYSPKYYTDGPSQDPLGPQTGEKRSIRSSSFADSADFAYPAHRFSLKPIESLDDLGFRCVVDDPTHFAPFCEQLAFIGSGPNGAESDCKPLVSCNDVGVEINEIDCNVGDAEAVTIVNFSVNGDPKSVITNMDAPGCDAGPGALQFTCKESTAGSPAKITGACVDTNKCDPVCGPNYKMDGGVCVWDGSGTAGTACFPGQTYDPVNKCCSAIPGSGVDYNVCPAGTNSIDGVCIADPANVVDSESKPITFDSCTPPEEEGGGCNPPVCKWGQVFDKATCSCK